RGLCTDHRRRVALPAARCGAARLGLGLRPRPATPRGDARRLPHHRHDDHWRSPVKRVLLVAGVAVAQLALVAVGVAPQLSARTSGETYRFAVSPVDPIDPFRGAYVDLQYPDLEPPDNFEHAWGEKIYVSVTE